MEILAQYRERCKKERQELGRIRQQLTPWFEARRIPLQRFDGLSLQNKGLLYRIVCEQATASYTQREALWKDLRRNDAREPLPSDSGVPTYDELIKFFSPPNNDLPRWKMF